MSDQDNRERTERERSPDNGNNDVDARNLFVGNIAYKTSDNDLRELFSKYGPVKDARVAMDRSGRSRGYAFVAMEESADGHAAMKGITGMQCDGREIRVEIGGSNGNKKDKPRKDTGRDRGDSGRDYDRKSPRRDDRDRDRDYRGRDSYRDDRDSYRGDRDYRDRDRDRERDRSYDRRDRDRGDKDRERDRDRAGDRDRDRDRNRDRRERSRDR